MSPKPYTRPTKPASSHFGLAYGTDGTSSLGKTALESVNSRRQAPVLMPDHGAIADRRHIELYPDRKFRAHKQPFANERREDFARLLKARMPQVPYLARLPMTAVDAVAEARDAERAHCRETREARLGCTSADAASRPDTLPAQVSMDPGPPPDVFRRCPSADGANPGYNDRVLGGPFPWTRGTGCAWPPEQSDPMCRRLIFPRTARSHDHVDAWLCAVTKAGGSDVIYIMALRRSQLRY